jgi:hypothetical protein
LQNITGWLLLRSKNGLTDDRVYHPRRFEDKFNVAVIIIVEDLWHLRAISGRSIML